MVTIYALIEGKKAYVGSTNQSLNLRLAQHKFTKKQHMDFLKAEIFELERCPDSKRYERENYWIDEKSKTHILLNRAKASIGPVGHKRPKECIDQAREEMKARWANHRSKMLKRVNSHKTKEYQSNAGKLGGVAKAKLRPFFEIVREVDGKIIGVFNDDLAAANAMGWTVHQFRHFKRGNKRTTGYVLRLK